MKRMFACLAGLAIISGCAATGHQKGASMSAFSSPTVSFGIVVSDIEKSLAFYKDAVGLVEANGFDVPVEMGGDSGLSDYKPFHVHMLHTMNTPEATSVKFMQIADTTPARVDNTFIHSSLGVSYLTFQVTDMTAAVERARKAGVKPIAKGPVLIPETLAKGIYLALLRDPDGNLIELVGPKSD